MKNTRKRRLKIEVVYALYGIGALVLVLCFMFIGNLFKKTDVVTSTDNNTKTTISSNSGQSSQHSSSKIDKLFTEYYESYNKKHGGNISKKEFAEKLLNSKDLLLVNKVVHMEASYEPSNLETLNNGNEQLSHVAAVAFNKMQDAYKKVFGEGFQIVSAYRSYDLQDQTHSHWVEVYGEKQADKVSAKAGESEHQTGYALDIQNFLNSELSENFGTTKYFSWLKNNAYKYGFVLRFPKPKHSVTGYTYEPWHYRYVGLQNAKIMRSISNDYTLEEYINYLKSI